MSLSVGVQHLLLIPATRLRASQVLRKRGAAAGLRRAAEFGWRRAALDIARRLSA